MPNYGTAAILAEFLEMYYFAYGSNMNLEHMRRLCGWHFSLAGTACLKGYEFGPDTRGYANIKENEKKDVWGVVYTVDDECLNILDSFEGVPEIFERKQVEIVCLEGKKCKAWVYIEKPEFFGSGSINQNYMKRVLAGAMENRLPEEWVEFLRKFISE